MRFCLVICGLITALWTSNADAQNAGNQDLRRIEADIADGCRNLQFWPRLPPAQLDEAGEALQKLSGEANLIATTKDLATLNRCLAGYELIMGGGPPDSLRKALPYLDRSLAFDPDQLLLRQNRTFLDQMLKTKTADFRQWMTTILQVLRGADDPEIPDVVQLLQDAADKNKKQCLLRGVRD
jgi:hypothetical protein